MSTIQRPTKQGGATTYQGKVTAGYTAILASEVDADIDTIYSAWNTGVDTVNIRDGSITGAKLAAGAVGTRELADSGVATVDLADGCVTTPKISDGSVTTSKLAAGAVTDVTLGPVPWSKITGGAVQDGVVPLVPRGTVDVTPTSIDLQGNLPGTPSYDNTKPSWLLRMDYSADAFQIFRAPPPGTAFQQIFFISNSGTLPNLYVGRAQLAVNAPNGSEVHATVPSGFVLNTANVWTTLVTLPSLTTRGGFVHLHANHCLCVTGPTGGAICNQRWLRDGTTQVATWPFNIAPAAAGFTPFPGLNVIDTTCPAGSHVYTYQVSVAPSCTMSSLTPADGLLQAVEIG